MAHCAGRKHLPRALLRREDRRLIGLHSLWIERNQHRRYSRPVEACAHRISFYASGGPALKMAWLGDALVCVSVLSFSISLARPRSVRLHPTECCQFHGTSVRFWSVASL